MSTMLFADEVVQVTELGENLSHYLQQVREGRSISIVQGKRADLAIVRRDEIGQLYSELERARKLIDQLEGLIETYEILNDPEMMEKIREGMEDVAQNRYVTVEEAKAALGLQ